MIVFNEAEMQRLELLLHQHVDGLADRIVNQAIQNASGRPGPRIRTGELVESIQKQWTSDADGEYVDIASTAVSPRQNYPYPSRLETGEDGVRYEWLRPAFDAVMNEQ